MLTVTILIRKNKLLCLGKTNLWSKDSNVCPNSKLWFVYICYQTFKERDNIFLKQDEYV